MTVMRFLVCIFILAGIALTIWSLTRGIWGLVGAVIMGLGTWLLFWGEFLSERDRP